MKRIGDTSDDATLLAKGALLELLERFPKLRERSAVGGGIAVAEWVGRPAWMGPLNTADVDLVLDIQVADEYPHLKKDLLESGLYEQRRDKRDPAKIIQFSYHRKGPGPRRVQIDFQGPEITGQAPAPSKVQTETIGDLSACVLVGGQMALAHSESRQIAGRTVDGSSVQGEARLVKPFILVPQKALAFMNRGLPRVDPEYRTVKDAADLYTMLKTLGPARLASDAKGYHRRSLFDYAREALNRHFVAREGLGGEGVDAVVEFTAGRIQETPLRTEVLELVGTYLKGIATG